MPSVLVTGFEPFGGDATNPTMEMLSRLPATVAGHEVRTMLLPVEYGTSADMLTAELEKDMPDALIMTGLAGGRDAVTPEQVAVNLRRARIPDNAGKQPCDERAVPDGPDALFSTLPVLAITKRMADEGYNIRLSYTAGTFVCNDVFYVAAERTRGTGLPLCFIHFPYMTRTAPENQPSMEIDEELRTLKRFLELALGK